MDGPAQPHRSDLPFLSAAPDSWYKGQISLPMPKAGETRDSEADFPQLTLDEVWHRKPLDAIVQSFQSNTFFDYHLKPFKSFWKHPDGRTERIYGESYSSDRAWEIEQEVHSKLTLSSNSEKEKVIVWMMLWSDSTHLAQFGTASLWPIYMYIGNLSKYIRVKPSSYSSHHLAYLPSIPDLVADMYCEIYGRAPTPAVMRFLKREVVAAVYLLLLDEEFQDAYLNGVEVTCADGVVRVLIPRFHSYSMDYPEKIIIVCIKFIGEYLCIRCTIHTKDVPRLGDAQDMLDRKRLERVDDEEHREKIEQARELIFSQGYSVDSQAVKNLLDSESLLPTRNAFSALFQQHGFDVFKFIPSDKLHEWDVGRCKDIIVHCVRILHCIGSNAVSAFDRRYIVTSQLFTVLTRFYRYRWVPTFGRGVIRRFHNNVSEMKKMAGRHHVAIMKVCL
ncbi:hypothetical protein EV360DRAFT_57052 [Lentinula raphanica]|nr:hypothetical protein EV360DRAFT_57052 [Lentinula raphanica]